MYSLSCIGDGCLHSLVCDMSKETITGALAVLDGHQYLSLFELIDTQ
jgi:hypothetical protein